ncbi:hypothetical protein [Xanthomonas hortorum]|uniref:Uncharacterized protein n=2 Tax=Xanthomonas hortorum pv. vitians TaxID=83224 RepID=A0AAW8ZXZ5_9XANT|nr:hypothetical protein [Xanthomonas hortorum]MDT7826862.1 hypothetical protein [Xanthomonas hortorum pv. vitians]MDV7251055.1 hypothetical protein [Xanthomonas hortorum pv. vitians]
MSNCTSNAQEVSVTSLVNQRVGPLNQIITPPTPLAGALQVAVIEALTINAVSKLEEEEMTAAFIGAMAATIPWFADAFPTELTPGFDWHKYSKSGRGETSEGSTGADFALLIRIGFDTARVAVFQAKQTSNDGSVNIHRMSPNRPAEGKLPQPQILRLAEHGLRALPNRSSVSSLTWVHYAAYENENCFCIPLSSITTVVDSYIDMDNSINLKLKERVDKLIEDKHPRLAEAAKEIACELWADHERRSINRNSDSLDLVHLLTIGASTPWGFDAPGWLPLDGKTAIDGFVQRTSGSLRLIEAYVALPPTPENTPTTEGGAPQSPKGKIVASLNKAAEGKDWTPKQTNSGKAVSRKLSV